MPDCLALFPPHLSYILVSKPGREDPTATGWDPLTSPPLGVPSLGPCQETEMSSGTELSTALLDWHPHTGPRFIHQLLQWWVKSHSLRPSLSPPFQVLALGGPTALKPLALCPIWFWSGGAHFKADYSYSLRRVWEQGCLSSQTFLLTFSCPCLPFLFGSNGKFSIPTLQIYSSWMPSPKPKSLGLPRGDKTRKNYLLF